MKDLPRRGAAYAEDSCTLPEFETLIAQQLTRHDAPLAQDIQRNIPIYDAGPVGDPDAKPALLAEWADILLNRSGVLVVRNAQPDMDAIDAASRVYEQIIADEKAAGGEGADHFAAAGHNDRIWNSLQKLCLTAPEVFARYFASPAIDAVCAAWLGPNYQMTAQINVVRPGGTAQQAHRDYHLGFQTAAAAAQYPPHVHHLSPALTLQGGIAHCDMPIESGPTKLLPFSQLYAPGYVAWRRDDFRSCFEANFVQLPLRKGDAIFFNPALFHAAGDNVSADISRMVNLLQISQAFGRAMESVDRDAMCRTLFPALKLADLSAAQRHAVLAASAEGYPFPTNLDTDPPSGGLAPASQHDVMRKALDEDWSVADLDAALSAQTARRRA